MALLAYFDFSLFSFVRFAWKGWVELGSSFASTLSTKRSLSFRIEILLGIGGKNRFIFLQATQRNTRCVTLGIAGWEGTNTKIFFFLFSCLLSLHRGFRMEESMMWGAKQYHTPKWIIARLICDVRSGDIQISMESTAIQLGIWVTDGWWLI